MNIIDHHHDGHGLNDEIEIEAGPIDPVNGGRHTYAIAVPRPGSSKILDQKGFLQFQHGPRHEDGSVHGVTDAAVLAVIVDRYEGFQEGPYACSDNESVIAYLKLALSVMKQRADARAARGVLGKMKK